MDIKKIVVPLTGEKRDEIVLKTAFAVARSFNAHVVGLFVYTDPNYAVPYDGMSISGSVGVEVVEALEAVVRDDEENARTALITVAAAENAAVTVGPRKRAGLSCSFRVRHGRFAHCVAEEVRLSDLVVFGPLLTSDEPELGEGFLDTLTKIERPVLIAPAAPAHFARQVAIAWDGGLASAHAVTGALPYILKAESVCVVTVGDACGEAALEDLKAYLGLYGIEPTLHRLERASGPVAGMLTAFAAKNGCDLLVMGGYGHGYLRETIFGGVTARIRWNPTLPVLMVH